MVAACTLELMEEFVDGASLDRDSKASSRNHGEKADEKGCGGENSIGKV